MGKDRIADATVLPRQFRQRSVVADEVLRAAGEVGELRGGDVDPQALVERGEEVAELNRPGFRLLGRREDLKRLPVKLVDPIRKLVPTDLPVESVKAGQSRRSTAFTSKPAWAAPLTESSSPGLSGRAPC